MPRGATPSRWCVCQFHHFGYLSKSISAWSSPLMARERLPFPALLVLLEPQVSLPCFRAPPMGLPRFWRFPEPALAPSREPRIGYQYSSIHRQCQRSHHKNHSRCGCCFRKHRRGAALAKGRLTGPSAKCAGPVRTLALLQEHHENQKQTNDHMNDSQQNHYHRYFTIAAKEVGSRLAPPTSAPSISSRRINSWILSGLTLPP